VYFIVLETEPVSNPHNQIPLILGRPNAIINRRNSQLILSFGHLTIELNIFNRNKQTRDFETEEVNMMNSFVDDTLELVVQKTSLTSIDISTISFEDLSEDELNFLHNDKKPRECLKDDFNSTTSNEMVHNHSNLWEYNDNYLNNCWE